MRKQLPYDPGSQFDLIMLIYSDDLVNVIVDLTEGWMIGEGLLPRDVVVDVQFLKISQNIAA